MRAIWSQYSENIATGSSRGFQNRSKWRPEGGQMAPSSVPKRLKNKALIIGDNLRTDIKGANLIKQDSLFILNGVHKKEIENSNNFNDILNKYDVKTNFIQKQLNW